MKRGRPSKFDKRFVDEAFKLALLGHTDQEMADFWETSTQTVGAWKKAHPAFLAALKRGKAEADARVSFSLFQRAVGGHEQEAVKIFMPAGAKKPVYAKYMEKYPPDVTAAIFWLKNRQRGKWRDKQEIENTGQPLIDNRTIIINGSELEPDQREMLRLTLQQTRDEEAA